MTGLPVDAPVGLRERKKREVKRSIRQAALSLIAARGYDSVSVEQIAHAADVSRTTFFNYFPSKEAVVTEPDEETLAAQRAARDHRPADEPLWEALSAVILEGLRHGHDFVAAQKAMKASSPALADVLHRASEHVIADLRDWATARVPTVERPLALLQLNAAIGAMTTAFEQWDVDQPYAAFLGLAEDYLARLGRAFATGQDSPPATSAAPARRARRQPGR